MSFNLFCHLKFEWNFFPSKWSGYQLPWCLTKISACYFEWHGNGFLPCLLTLFHSRFAVFVTTHYVYATVSWSLTDGTWLTLNWTLFIWIQKWTEYAKAVALKLFISIEQKLQDLADRDILQVGGDNLYSFVTGHISLTGSIFLKNRHFSSKKGLINWYIVLILS